MSDEEDKMLSEAKAKLSEAELDALTWNIYDKTLSKVNDWICKDIENSDHLKRNDVVTYYRIIWLISSGNEIKPKVDEEESEKIKYMRKLGYSMRELARMFQRSKATIHSHIEGSLTRDEQNELLSEVIESKMGE